MNNNDTNQGRESTAKFLQYCRIIFRWKWLIVAAICVSVALAFVSASKQHETFSVESVLEIGQVQVGQSTPMAQFAPVNTTIEWPTQVVEKIKDGVYDRAAALELGTDQSSIPAIDAVNPSSTNIIVLTANVSNIKTGEDSLGAVTDAIIKEHQTLASAYHGSIIVPTRVVKPASDGISPVYPHKKQDIIVAAIFGIFLGIFLAFCFEWLSIVRADGKSSK